MAMYIQNIREELSGHVYTMYIQEYLLRFLPLRCTLASQARLKRTGASLLPAFHTLAHALQNLKFLLWLLESASARAC